MFILASNKTSSRADTSLVNVLTYGAKAHSKYPFDVYGKGILRFCTYAIPYTLIQYYPLQFLLSKTRNWYLPFWPLGIIVYLLICYLIWRYGVNHAVHESIRLWTGDMQYPAHPLSEK